jgi:hypothetical protein
MPRIHQRLVGTSLYIYASPEDAKNGSSNGGSGVLIGQPSGRYPGMVHVYAVTNAHVVRCGGVVARAGTGDGGVRVYRRTIADWYLHPDGEDVAICWIGSQAMDDDQAIQWVPREWIVLPADFRYVPNRLGNVWGDSPLLPGEETFSVVRFIGYDGLEHNQPTIRFGNLSSSGEVEVQQEPMPENPTCVERRIQRSLLVEARSLSGYSGAPVFAYREAHFLDIGHGRVESALLLGIGWAHITHPAEKDLEYAAITVAPGQLAVGRYNSGMMAVVPGWHITELLDLADVASEREAMELQQAGIPGAVADARSSSAAISSQVQT